MSKKEILKKIKSLEEELDWLENTPLYIGRDGFPSMSLIILMIFTGFLWGIIIIYFYRKNRKKRIVEEINELKKQVSSFNK